MTDTAAAARKFSALANWREYIIYIGFLVIFLVFAATLGDRGFLDPNNLLNIIRQTAIIAVVSVTMTFVLSTGEIDLSVGAVAGLAWASRARGSGTRRSETRRRSRTRCRSGGRCARART